MNDLYAANTPAAFWRPVQSISPVLWDGAARAAAGVLPPGPSI